MKASFVFLGSGGSLGIPVIGCDCRVCKSSSPYNNRLRPSALLKVNGKDFLIDAGPDLRTQALKYDIRHLDGILLTHAHFDHIAGLDDLRIFYYMQKERLPCLLSEETLDELKTRFFYLFQPFENGSQLGIFLDMIVLKEDFGAVDFQGIKWNYLSYFQAGMKVTGYRIGNFAYVSDIRQYSEKIFESLQGVEILVLSAPRPEPSSVHFSIDEGVAFAREAGAQQTWFTHIAHDLEHEETNAKLPKGFNLSYDGQVIDFEV
jgi:phosphoribosyl 1,2-cyclic phosphate phosphodiesterase